MSSPALIHVATIASAQGIRGEVRVFPLSDSLEEIAKKPLLAQSGKPFTLKLIRFKPPHWIAAIEGVTDRNAAEALKNTKFFAPETALPRKRAGEWFVHELVGLAAVDEAGNTHGTVAAVHDFGAGTVLELEGGAMYPFKPAFFGDVKGKTILFFPPEVIEAKP